MSRFRWWRKWRGGTWYLVAPWPSMPYIDPAWVRKPNAIERILETEVWS